MTGPQPSPAGPQPYFPKPDRAPGPADPDHPQWVRRRRKLAIMFGGSLSTFLGIGLAGIANMIGGRPVDPNAAALMWPLGSIVAASAGIYVWQGVRRTGWQAGRRGGWHGGAEDWR